MNQTSLSRTTVDCLSCLRQPETQRRGTRMRGTRTCTSPDSTDMALTGRAPRWRCRAQPRLPKRRSRPTGRRGHRYRPRRVGGELRSPRPGRRSRRCNLARPSRASISAPSGKPDHPRSTARLTPPVSRSHRPGTREHPMVATSLVVASADSGHGRRTAPMTLTASDCGLADAGAESRARTRSSRSTDEDGDLAGRRHRRRRGADGRHRFVVAGDGTAAITPSLVVIDAPSDRARW